MSRFPDLGPNDILYFDNWVDAGLSDYIFDELIELSWQNEFIKIFGRTVKVPRKVIWVGDPDTVYNYSGVTHQPSQWLDCLLSLKSMVSKECACEFNSSLFKILRRTSGEERMGRNV